MWDADDFLAKAKNYGARASANGVDEVARGLFISICLEMLAKAVLARQHPAFVSDQEKIDDALRAWKSGLKSKTLFLSKVLERLAIVHPEIRHRLVRDLQRFVESRNSEVHSSNSSFESIGEKYWLPLVVDGIAHLADLLGEEPERFISRELIEKSSAYRNGNSAELKERVEALLKAAELDWKKVKEDQKAIDLKRAVADSKFSDHPQCPACRQSLLNVTPSPSPIATTVSRTVRDLERSSQFEVLRVTCPVCAFALNDPHEISVAGLPEELTLIEPLSWDELYQEEYFEEYGDE